MNARVFFIVGSWWIASCGQATEIANQQVERGTSVVGGDVVATVHGHPITVGEIEEVARAASLAPREAAIRLEEEALLAAEASRQGYGNDHGVIRVRQQALIQAFLRREIEDAHSPASIAAEDVMQAYAAAGVEFNRPETRRSVHILVSAPLDADPDTNTRAVAVIRFVIEEIRAGVESGSIVRRYHRRNVGGVRLTAQDVPLLSRDANAAREYKEALFSMQEPGLYPDPVRTGYGWHAIVYTGSEPAMHVPLEEADATLRTRLATRDRRATTDALLLRLRREAEIVEQSEAIQRALALPPGESNR